MSVWAFTQGIIGLGIVIFVHELGHFLVAKACGVKCEKFYVGFDVPIRIGPWTVSSLWKMQWGETEYGIGTIPLGGYVKMLGQDDNPNAAEEETERTKVRNVDEQGNEIVEVDPRSYTAKSVPQRMAIISAGVIFNLIFGVIFAAIAFNLGVPYTPTQIGFVQPGSPAWHAGLRPGDEIVGFSADGPPREHLRFDHDLLMEVVYNGPNKEMPVHVRHLDGELRVHQIQPRKAHEKSQFPTLGIRPMRVLEVAVTPETLGLYYEQSLIDSLHNGDILTHVNGMPLESFIQWESYVASHPYDTLTLTFKPNLPENEASVDSVRPTQPFDVDLPPARYRHTGLLMEMSPVLQVRSGSPAHQAGIQKGDRITKIDGEEIGDPFTLTSRESRWIGREVEVEVQRAGQTETFTVEGGEISGYAVSYNPGDEIGLETLGLTFSISNKVVGVIPGSPAAEAGIAAGDDILRVEFKTTDADSLKLERALGLSSKPIELVSDDLAWQVVQSRILWSHPNTRISIDYRQASTGEGKSTTLNPVIAEEEAVQYRFLNFRTLERIQYADGLFDGLALGVREVGEGMTRVIATIQKIATGQLAFSNLGGPGTILAVASAQSSRGLSSLLLFLTLISANLAIVNFLPIPVLDGGHMMFLLYEGIRGKPVDEKWMIRLTYMGLAMVLLLMVSVIGLDINRFFPWE